MDPKHVNTLGNLALLVRNHKQDMGEAESLYRRALDVDPKHVNTLYNLNLLLQTMALRQRLHQVGRERMDRRHAWRGGEG